LRQDNHGVLEDRKFLLEERKGKKETAKQFLSKHGSVVAIPPYTVFKESNPTTLSMPVGHLRWAANNRLCSAVTAHAQQPKVVSKSFLWSSYRTLMV